MCEGLHDDVELLSFRINLLFQAKLLQIKVWEIISSEPIRKFKYHMNGFYLFNSIHVTVGMVLSKIFRRNLIWNYCFTV